MNIFIDQGHNPQNPNAGAEYGGVREQDINYTVGVLVADILRTVPGIHVHLSRNTPYEQLGTSNATSLAARVNAANSWPADYFLSLHCNISVNYPEASGSEAYTYYTAGPAYDLGLYILDGLNKQTVLPNRGVIQNTGLYVLRRTTLPAVLVEMGFLSNAVDRHLLVERPDLFAQGIADGTLEYLRMK